MFPFDDVIMYTHSLGSGFEVSVESWDRCTREVEAVSNHLDVIGETEAMMTEEASCAFQGVTNNAVWQSVLLLWNGII